MTARKVFLLYSTDGGVSGVRHSTPAVLAMDLRVGDVLANGTPVKRLEKGEDISFMNSRVIFPWQLTPLQSIAPDVPEPEEWKGPEIHKVWVDEIQAFELPRIEDASKLTPGSVIRADWSNMEYRLIENNGREYPPDNQWTVTKADGSEGGPHFFPSRQIETDFRLVSLAPVPLQVGDLVDRADADRLHIDGVVIRDPDGDVGRWVLGGWKVTGYDDVDTDDYWAWTVEVIALPRETT